MTKNKQRQLGATLWSIADELRGAMNADDFRDYMLALLFLRYLSDNYEQNREEGTRTRLPRSEHRLATAGAPPCPSGTNRTLMMSRPLRSRCGSRRTMSFGPDYLWASIAWMSTYPEKMSLLETFSKPPSSTLRTSHSRVRFPVFSRRLISARTSLAKLMQGPEREALRDHHQDR